MSQLVVEISWSEGSVPRTETYGPWTVKDDDSHLGEIEEFMREWLRLSNWPPQRATMALVSEPAAALEALAKAKEARG